MHGTDPHNGSESCEQDCDQAGILLLAVFEHESRPQRGHEDYEGRRGEK